MKNTKKVIRHGDIALVNANKKPAKAILSKDNILATGSHGNSHTFTGGKFYKVNEGYVIGYLQANNTKLFHPEHSPKGVKIPNGIYEVRKQQEVTPQGLIFVQD